MIRVGVVAQALNTTQNTNAQTGFQVNNLLRFLLNKKIPNMYLLGIYKIYETPVELFHNAALSEDEATVSYEKSRVKTCKYNSKSIFIILEYFYSKNIESR